MCGGERQMLVAEEKNLQQLRFLRRSWRRRSNITFKIVVSGTIFWFFYTRRIKSFEFGTHCLLRNIHHYRKLLNALINQDRIVNKLESRCDQSANLSSPAVALGIMLGSQKSM